MRLQLLANFLRLRYRLLWAQARLRNGKMALFVVGYLLLSPLIALIAFGGIGAALASIRTGNAEALAGTLLSIGYLTMAVAAILLALGTNSVFSETALRRYPISAMERFAVRHIAGCLEPLWILWEGNITSLADNQPISHEDKKFHTLEELYLHVSGGRSHVPLTWL